jgi:hypothetical protein
MRIVSGSWIRIRIKVKTLELLRLTMEPWRAVDARNGGVEAQNGGLEWRVCRPVVADSDHLDKEQDPDPHRSEKLDPDPHYSDADPKPCQSQGTIQY